jgi:hypothetical protein
MSEFPANDAPEILGLPPFKSPLADPDTGVMESMFGPRPGEEVPPADILAEVFTPRGEEGMSIPGTLDEINLTLDSLGSFYNRTDSDRIHNRLNVYAHALQRAEDRLDPPVNRYLRLFKEELPVKLKDEDGFYGIMEEFFGKPAAGGSNGNGNGKPSPELYQRLAAAFQEDPKTLGIFLLFSASAEDKRLVRKGLHSDRMHLIYVPLATALREGQEADPDASGRWFVDAVRSIEEMHGEMADKYPDLSPDAPGKKNIYSVLESMAQVAYIGPNSSGTDMYRYDYSGLSEMLHELNASMITQAEKDAAAKFTLDVSRNVGRDILEQGVVRSDDGLDIRLMRVDAMPVLKLAMKGEDGYHTTSEGFQSTFYDSLGIDRNLVRIKRSLIEDQAA